MQDYEELLEEQESNVLRAFLNLDSPFEVRSEFSHHKLNFTTQSAIREPSKKEDEKNKPLNVLVDEDGYANVIDHNVHKKAIEHARKNLTLVLNKTGDNVNATTMENTQDNEGSSNDASRNIKLNDCSLAKKTLPDIDSIVFLLEDALPNVDRNSLIGMVQKSLELLRTDSIKPGFLNGQCFVKSYSNYATHNVSVTEKNIKCYQAYPRYRDNYYCSHALSVAIIGNAIHRYAESLSRIVKPNLTAIASKNVGRNVGKKKPVKERKRTKAYTPEKVSLKYNNTQPFQSNNPVGLQSGSSTIPSTFQPQPTSRFSHTASSTCFQLTAQTSSSPNMLLNVQRSSDQPFALSFRAGTYDQLLTPAVSDNAYQIPSTTPQSSSSFNRCSVPQVRFNNDHRL